MQSANTTALPHKFFFLAFFSTFFFSLLHAQDNSPYSRYGLGNEYPRMNVINRGMGGVSAAYSDVVSINYNNPASYAGFQVYTEQRSKKVSSARVILDAAINFDSRTLTAPNTTNSFTSNDLLFSHIYVGIPIRRNWGLTFGIRPLSRISYNILRTERLSSIDSVFTQYSGSGGSFLPSVGTGFGTDHFRVGVNIGYLFGKKEVVTHRGFLNDSVAYAASNHTTNTNFGNLFFTTGVQYKIVLKRDNSNIEKTSVTLGASGNWKQTLNGTQDILRQTYSRDANGQELQIDSVFQQSDIKGNVVYPATYTAGIMFDLTAGQRTGGWNIGVDYSAGKWNDFRFFGTQDLVQNNWEVRVGAQVTPSLNALQNGKLKSYRFGFFTGRDYIKVGQDLPVYGVTLGLGLPLRNYSRLTNQASIINLGLEYTRRGNDKNVIKENMIRLSLGLNFTDFWFGKRKYD